MSQPSVELKGTGARVEDVFPVPSLPELPNPHQKIRGSELRMAQVCWSPVSTLDQAVVAKSEDNGTGTEDAVVDNPVPSLFAVVLVFAKPIPQHRIVESAFRIPQV